MVRGQIKYHAETNSQDFGKKQRIEREGSGGGDGVNLIFETKR
jgi:hypothetical protein